MGMAPARDVGNICRCICGEASLENTTILVPAADGCHGCNTELCRETFTRCALAEGKGGAVSVHCIDRSAILPRLAIASLLIMTVLLVSIAFGKNRFKFLRRIHELIGHRSA